MLAAIQQMENGYTARFERFFSHSVAEVWSYLTENDKLVKWFSELRVEDLREGGTIKFDMRDGSFLDIEIIALKHQSLLAYTWGEDSVKFELYPETDGCRLVLTEKLSKITAHTPKDLAGWHVCLEVISALLDGTVLESRENEWKIWYERYSQLTESFS